jgi:hypothetical protein
VTRSTGRKQPTKKIRLDFNTKTQFAATDVKCQIVSCSVNSSFDNLKDTTFYKIRSDRGRPQFLCEKHAQQNQCSILDEIEILF